MAEKVLATTQQYLHWFLLTAVASVLWNLLKPKIRRKPELWAHGLAYP